MLIGTLALSASMAFAAQAKVHNNCGFPVWVNSVQGKAGLVQKVASGYTFSEEQKPTDNGIGVSVQITMYEDGRSNNDPILIMGYSWDKHAGLYYSLSTVKGFDFWGRKLRIHNTEGKPLEEIVWMGEPEPDYTAAYLNGEADITLELCD